jgi:formate hydrogenlyase subunit 6/NADH:ubiquinone oxidoreductase subunit I
MCLIDAAKREDLPELYHSREECCGCTACAAACPVDAISMEPDEEGFDYPVVDASACITCQTCVSACAFKRPRITHQ